MIKNLKSLLVVEITALQEKSANIIDVFTKTINDLETVNTEINTACVSRANKIAELAKEQETLIATRTANDKIISKLSLIIKD